MTTRDHAPIGAPCWTDLWTSDVEASRRFYAELFGWEALEPNPEFGGYFMFARDGVPVAGGMGPMPDMPADNRWKVYFATDDIAKTVDVAATHGAQVVSPPMDVADLGRQAVVVDPAGAPVGAWQAGTFPGFTVLDEPGSPSWFELQTRDHAGSVDFYRTVFRWDTNVEGDSDEFRYTTMRDPDSDGFLAGIMDGAQFLPTGTPASWSVYWEVDDAADVAARAQGLGASVVMGLNDTPYGKLVALTDPTGAGFNLRTAPR
jgi:uncharacterized protein